jgi:hypothetical protein
MVAAVSLVHVGVNRSSRATAGVEGGVAAFEVPGGGGPAWSGHRTAAAWFGLALLVILAAIPWPFLPYGRPLLPFL